MNINVISPVSFKGVWEKSFKSIRCKGYDKAEITESIYHPFKDEKIPADIEASTAQARGIKYLEYENSCASIGNEDLCLNIETTKIGSRLDITTEEYDKLVATKKMGEEASKKLQHLGSATKSKGMTNESEITGKIARTRKTELGNEEVSKILTEVNYLT